MFHVLDFRIATLLDQVREAYAGLRFNKRRRSLFAYTLKSFVDY